MEDSGNHWNSFFHLLNPLWIFSPSSDSEIFSAWFLPREALVTSKQSLLVTFEPFPNSYHSHSKN